MGKKQHQKDKLWLTCTEWSTIYGGKKAADGDNKQKFKRLPFNCCCITFLPFTHPYCTKEGVIFDLENIVPFLKKFAINPVTGEKMTPKELIKLNFYKNAAGEYHCPVTYKVFNENSHIVAITKTGNVYSYEAIDRLNLKPNCMKDLISNETFSRADILNLQDPASIEKFNISNFYHVQKKLLVEDKSSMKNIRAVNQETKETLTELQKLHKPMGFSTEKKSNAPQRARDEFNTANYSTGKAAASLTSTVMEPTTSVEAAVLEDDVVRYARVRSKGYVRMITNFGQLNFELHCDWVPKACENFIVHCRNGYYDDTKFHRLIRYFVLQGGDPTGTGNGGESIWGKPFRDEYYPKLTHDARGILSMANSGRNTNQSQFYITLRSAKHLNNKHTVFGKLVGGFDTLDKIEVIETDKDDRPIEDVVIQSCVVFVNPFEEADKELAELRATSSHQKAQQKEAEYALRPGNRAEEEAMERAMLQAAAAAQGGGASSSSALKEYRSGVGKFLKLNKETRRPPPTLIDADSSETAVKKKRKLASLQQTGNFSNWD